MAQTGAELKTEQSFPDFSSVPVDQVDIVWSALLPMIKSGLSKGQGDATTPEHIRAAIKRKDMLMWVVHQDEDIIACIILSVRTHESSITKVFIHLLAGKDMDWWGDKMEQLLLDFKDLAGAKCIEASCRPGMAKYLHNRGWSKKAVIMELT